MKKAKLFLLFITIYNVVIAQDSIHFTEGSWSQIIAVAKKEHKPIFVDCYTVWCGPCKWMANHIFTNDTVAQFYNSNFICYKADMEKNDDGRKLKYLYNINSYPTFLFINNEDHLLYRITTRMEALEFIKLAKDALDSTTNYYHFKKKYDHNTRKVILSTIRSGFSPERF